MVENKLQKFTSSGVNYSHLFEHMGYSQSLTV